MNDSPKSPSAVAVATGGRNCSLFSEQPEISLDVRVPRESGGDGHGTTPNQLFALAYAASFAAALDEVAEAEDLTTDGWQVRVTLAPVPEGTPGEFSVNVEVANSDMDEDTTRRLTTAADEICPYARAVRGNVDITLRGCELL
ncbi:MAG: Ohr family peroxiredoxin [Bowdeniella nasicola]|nr:Ohr family peroxiredoxin [Bowdeniella nasicola]